MAGNRPRTVYWDTNIFLAWLKNEGNSPEEVGGMREHRELFVSRQIRLATSVLTITEILKSTLPENAKEKLLALEGRRNFQYVQASTSVARLAHEIRDYYFQLNDLPATVSTADAFHLASAIITPGCRELYTFDGRNGKKVDDHGNRTLIPLSGKIAGKYDLKIGVPSTQDLSLLDSLGHE